MERERERGTKGALINYEFVNCYENGRLGVPNRSGTTSKNPLRFLPPHPSSCDFVVAGGVARPLPLPNPALGRQDAVVGEGETEEGKRRRRERVELCYLI